MQEQDRSVRPSMKIAVTCLSQKVGWVGIIHSFECSYWHPNAERQKIHRLQEVVSNLNAVVMDSSLCESASTLEQTEINTDSDGDISLGEEQ